MGEYILVVEDEAHLRELLALEVQAITRQVVRTACSGTAAIAVLAIWGKPSLVLSDHVMLDGDGIELARYCAEAFPLLPFVLCSSADERSLRQGLGALYGVLPKPIIPAALEQLLEPFAVRPGRKSG